MVYLTRIEKFNAAHRLYVDHWTEEKNKEVFGKCCNKNWHGHNYTLHVTVAGEPDHDTGFVMDARELSSIINEHILSALDHSNLNLDEHFIPKNLQPTTEIVAKYIFLQLAPHITKARLHSIRLFETDTIYAEYLG